MEQLSDLTAPLAFILPVAIVGAIATYLEWQFPRRNDAVPISRWVNSVVLYIITVPMLAVVMPLIGYAVAKWSEMTQGGLLFWIDMPVWVRAVLTFLILDFLIFLSHLAMHRIRIFWRAHRVHHSDTVISASTGLLHHPFEALLLNVSGFLIIPFLGLQGEGVLAFGFVQFLFNIWLHTNVANFPGQYALGTVIFTPDLHRVHHSTEEAHYTANLGLVFTIWDRMFGTYVRERDLDMRISFGLGTDEWRHSKRLGSLLVDPFRK